MLRPEDLDPCSARFTLCDLYQISLLWDNHFWWASFGPLSSDSTEISQGSSEVSLPGPIGRFNHIVKHTDQVKGKARNGLHLKRLNIVYTSKGCFASVTVKRHFLAMPGGFQPRFQLSAWHLRREVEKWPTNRKVPGAWSSVLLRPESWGWLCQSLLLTWPLTPTQTFTSAKTC